LAAAGSRRLSQRKSCQLVLCTGNVQSFTFFKTIFSKEVCGKRVQRNLHFDLC